ncbi:MAG: GntR family transcriptional regulator [Clostridiales bacterium]|nr:GntR family transcriptional regulator [Clostridiales bacterium]
MIGDFRSDQPIYTQLVEQVTLAILSGEFPPGGKLPSVRELAAQAGVNPNTMQRAFSELERGGLIFSQRTSGRFVTEDTVVIEAAKERLARQRLMEFLQSMRLLGYDNKQVLQLLQSREEDLNGHTDM